MTLRLTATLLFAAAIAAADGGIVSTAPGFTETLFALGQGKRVVAVSEFCHYPPEVNKLPRIGTYLQPNIEAIARLRPEVVLIHSELKTGVSQLQQLGIRTVAVKNTSLEDVLTSVRAIAKGIGVEPEGARLEKALRDKLKQIEQAASSRPRRSVLFVIGRTPGQLDGMIAVGRGSFLNEIMRIAGGRNVLADSPVTYPKISIEAVIRLDPDVIVDMGDMAVTTNVTKEHMQSVLRLWQAQPGIRAATLGNVHPVAADIFVVPGPRVVEAAQAFADMLNKVKGPAK